MTPQPDWKEVAKEFDVHDDLSVVAKRMAEEIVKLREEVAASALFKRIENKIDLAQKLRASEAREMVLRKFLRESPCVPKWSTAWPHNEKTCQSCEALTTPAPDTALLIRKLVAKIEKLNENIHYERCTGHSLEECNSQELADTQETRRSLGL